MLQGTGKAFADLITICDNHAARESRIDAQRELTKANERLGVDSLDASVPAAEAKKYLDGLIKRPELARIRRQIRAAVHLRYAAKVLEGEVAQNIIDNRSTFSSVVGFNQIIMRDAKNRLGEIDVHPDNAVVECTLREAGKEKQLRKLVGDRTVNPEGKTVILYAPKYRVDAQRLIPNGVLVVRDPAELGTALFALKAKSLGWLGAAQ